MLQQPSNPHAEHFGGVEPDILHHLPGHVIVFGYLEEEHLDACALCLSVLGNLT